MATTWRTVGVAAFSALGAGHAVIPAHAEGLTESALPAVSVTMPVETAAASDGQGGGDVMGPPDPVVDATTERSSTASAEVPEKHYPTFPLFARQAIDRGYSVQRAFGGSAMFIHNVQNMDGRNLSVALAKGSDPGADAALIDVPFVTADKLESRTTNSQFKADMWLLPFLNVFAAVGKVKGHMDVAVDIDLDEAFPFTICRPAKPCGTLNLPFKADIDNTSLTFGSILAYGTNDWAVAGTIARTVSSSSKDRSDITTTDISARVGPRLHFDHDTVIMPYMGVSYFDMDATVKGYVASGPAFSDGDNVGLRYKIDLSTSRPWAVINGFNLEINPHWSLMAEYNWGGMSDRFVMTVTVRP